MPRCEDPELERGLFGDLSGDDGGVGDLGVICLRSLRERDVLVEFLDRAGDGLHGSMWESKSPVWSLGGVSPGWLGGLLMTASESS